MKLNLFIYAVTFIAQFWNINIAVESKKIVRNLNESLSKSINFSCYNATSCSNNGNCINGTYCQCFEGYTTINNIDLNPSSIQCSYPQKSKNVAFYLSFFLGPMSFDQLYLGNMAIGFCKFLIPSFLILLGVAFFVHGKTKDWLYLQIAGRGLEFFATLLLVTWWVIDWILIVANHYNDSNNIPLY